ncbi:MAG: MaoC family dehydratase [Burkholderiaceae bacterium]
MTVSGHGFRSGREDRWLDDYVPGNVHELGEITVSQHEIIEFASRFDPQPFHVDEKAAADTIFGGIIASGWHTAALVMRVLVDHYLSSVASLSSPGIDELRWLQPVRPGERLALRATVLGARVSRSKPDRGLVQSLFELRRVDDDEPVMTMKALNLFACRPGTQAASPSDQPTRKS